VTHAGAVYHRDGMGCCAAMNIRAVALAAVSRLSQAAAALPAPGWGQGQGVPPDQCPAGSPFACPAVLPDRQLSMPDWADRASVGMTCGEYVTRFTSREKSLGGTGMA
jgi:hypothetical protein